MPYLGLSPPPPCAHTGDLIVSYKHRPAPQRQTTGQIRATFIDSTEPGTGIDKMCFFSRTPYPRGLEIGSDDLQPAKQTVMAERVWEAVLQRLTLSPGARGWLEPLHQQFSRKNIASTLSLFSDTISAILWRGLTVLSTGRFMLLVMVYLACYCRGSE